MTRPPRFPLAVLPTPLLPVARLPTGFPVLVKRDDLTGFGTTGNKARALEYLLGAAMRDGADVLVAGGSRGSHFLQGVALAAACAGLGCELVVAGEPDSVNLRIACRAGARLHPLGHDDRTQLDDGVLRLADELAAAGRRPYPMPRGGATPTGAIGFATAACELHRQLAERDADPHLVVIAVGSGGSCAGLLAGAAEWPAHRRILGVSVSRPLAEITPIVGRLAAACAGELGLPPPDAGRLELVDARGPGFGVPAPGDLAAASTALTTEGLLLDDTYTAKSMSVLLGRAGNTPVVYWHTGGLASAIDRTPMGWTR
jgi:1-aminocyclopropane-1-carboxylate deaminase/D-cysteine desulfhydrase-like pyridoxal-dependent ACC family enzyme